MLFNHPSKQSCLHLIGNYVFHGIVLDTVASAEPIEQGSTGHLSSNLFNGLQESYQRNLYLLLDFIRCSIMEWGLNGLFASSVAFVSSFILSRLMKSCRSHYHAS